MSDTTDIDTRQIGADNENTALVFNDEDNIEDMYLTFGLAAEEYGIGIGYVTEVVGMQRIMEVPDVPPFIKGVINLRGKVIPVMDVRIRFGMAEIDYTERTVIIVLDIDNVLIGLVVDHVSEVLEIPAASIDQVNQFGGGSDSVIKGYGKQGDKVAIMLDIQRLVSDQAVDLRKMLESARNAA
ncbi:chemotaxis protein CheW [Candidatus Methylobacter oryzae]|uniref:Chemotaxis protein CheW n=1 Tax=Candidatus Methylobacter oryzae TaxID=2497749 RepID=A0ABY3CE97_9GAMM|nr:chemotaxis protein CheW [Candidatus Methylobacter oryzae]TRX01411.1 purine-binding chemotaxis protein CheW [Candidatus Methylobacter oryzae]